LFVDFDLVHDVSAHDSINNLGSSSILIDSLLLLEVIGLNVDKVAYCIEVLVHLRNFAQL